MSVSSQTLLDEVGHLQHSHSPAEIAAWKQALKAAYPSAERAAWLHVWLGEWELAQNQQPERAAWHFRQAQRLTNPHNRCYGLAAYDQAMTLFYGGAYADASDAFAALLHPKTGFPGYDRRNCALWLRHAQLCAGFHADHAKLGIPEPPRLDPYCGAASLAACLRSLSLPYSRQAVLKVCTVTGEGSTLPDVLNAGRKLGLNARSVTADDQGLMALPMPLVAYVEQDHFVALVRADKAGVSYLCSDCGPWPGGRVDLTWAQWHALSPGVYGCVTRPGSASDALVQAAVSPLVKQGRGSGVRLSYTGSLASLGLSSLRVKLHFQVLASALRGHVVRYIAPTSSGCGIKPYSLHCPDWAEGAMYRPGSPGDGPQQCDPVNLATGEEEYAPAPDLTVYNAAGPTIAWGRVYNSLRAPDATSLYYNSADFGVGWSNSYSYRIVDSSPGSTAPRTIGNPLKLILPNGAIVPITGTPPVLNTYTPDWNACVVPAGTPFRVDWGFNAIGNTAPGYYFAITMADRSRFIFYPAVINQNSISTQVFLLHSIMDKNGYSIGFGYQYGTAGLLTSVGNSSGNSVGITINRNSDSTIQSVTDGLGHVVFYHVTNFPNANIPTSYPANEKNYPELDNVSSVAINTNQQNPFYATLLQPSTFVPGTSRWTYGYTPVQDGDGSQAFVALSGIAVPSPASAGGTITPATAHINYGTNFVTSLVDANNNTTTFTPSADGIHTKVALTDANNNPVYSYTVGFDPNMNMLTKTDGSNSTVVLTKTFSPTSLDPYRPVSVTNGNGNSWQFVWDQYGNLHRTTSPRGTVTNYTWAFSGTVPNVVNSVAQATAPVLGELISVQQGSKAATTYTYCDTDPAYLYRDNPLSPDSANSGLVKTITTAQPGVPGATNSASYSFTYDGGNPLTITRPGNNATGSITTAYEYDYDYVNGYTPVTSGGTTPFTTNDYHHPLTITEELYPLQSTNSAKNPVTHYRYDDQGHVYRMDDALGNETDFGGQQWNNTSGYNAAGQLLLITYPATGQTGSGRSYTTFTYLYVGGPLISKKLYDESGNLVRQVNYTYGPEGELLNVSGSTEPVSYAYDALYRLTALQDGNGHVTHYYYNVAGYLDSVIYPGYSGAAFPSISGPDSLHFTYDLGGNLATRTNGNGVITSYNHTTDPESLLKSVQYSYPSGYAGSAAGNVALFYDAYGRPSTITDGTGTTSYGFGSSPGYDDLDNPLNVQTTYSGLPAEVMSYGYYPDGSRKSMSFPARTNTYTYDTIGRMTGLTDQYGESAAWQYYPTGWVQYQSDSNGLVTVPYYNALGQIVDITNTLNTKPLSEFGQNQINGLVHDAAGNLTSVPATIASPNASLSGTTSYQYDSGQTTPAGNRSQLTQETSTRGGTFGNQFSYDPAGNPVTNRGLAGVFNIDNQSTALSYDGNGNLLTQLGMSLSYDPENRLTSAANPPGNTVADVAVGASDNRTRVLWHNTNGTTSLWTINDISNLSQPAPLNNWTYGPYPGWTATHVAVDPNNAVHILWVRTDGLISLWTLNASGSFVYNPDYTPAAGFTTAGIAAGADGLIRLLFTKPDGTMTVWTVPAGGGAPTASYTWSGSSNGWMPTAISVGGDGLTRVLWYNHVIGAITVWKITNLAAGSFTQNAYYSPYASANMPSTATPTSLSVGPDNQTQVLWSTTAGYLSLWSINDWSGSTSSGPMTYYNYGPYPGFLPAAISVGADLRTRVAWCRTDGYLALWSESGGGFAQNVYGPYPASGSSPALTCGYRGDGLRAWKQSGGVTTYYLYDGKDPVCELNSSGQVNGVSMFGANGLLNYNGSGHGTLYYAFDERGNVAERVDGTGNVPSTDLYDAYGKQLAGASDPYGFGGQAGYRTDPETGLIYLTNRYYDPGTGRFLSRDPSGYGGGINLYSYVQNNPGNFDDPLGLCGGDDAEPGFWDAVGSGLNVGLKATASAMSLGAYDGGDAKCDPDFGTSKQLAGYGRDAAIMAATMGGGGELVAAEEGGALESGAEGAEEAGEGCLRCFTDLTPVHMGDGSTKRIADVQVGDKVISRNPATGRDEVKTVTATIKRFASAVVTVALTDAKTGQTETLTCTPEHPFFTVGGGWVEAGSLGIGTSIVSRAGPALSVTGLTWKRDSTKELEANGGVGSVAVYNLTVADDHTFFVGTTGGGTWVHNVDCGGLDLDQKAVDHIAKRHWATSDTPSGEPAAGKFDPSTSLRDLRDAITDTVQNGAQSPNTLGRPGTKYLYDLGDNIGVDRLGNPTQFLRVIGNNGRIITAFPE